MRDRESFQQFTFSGMLFDRHAATPELLGRERSAGVLSDAS